MQYSVKIVPGAGRGRVLGFPTYNLEIPEGFTLEYGIYSATVVINQKNYVAAMHYGPIPTFATLTPTLELFILDYIPEEQLDELTFSVGSYLREIMTFSTPAALTEQIKKDVERIRKGRV